MASKLKSFLELEFWSVLNFWDKSVNKNIYSNWVFKISLEMSSNKNIKNGLAFFIWKCENTSNGSKMV